MSAYLVRPEDVSGDRAILRGEEHRHLTTSARVRCGESIRLTDGRGSLYHGIVEAVSKNRTEVRLTSRTFRERESPVSITLGVALLKGRKMDLVLQKACELGVEAILPYTGGRSIARVVAGDRARQERWRRIIVAATKQCERAWLASLRPIATWDQVLAEVAGHDRAFVFHEKAGAVDWDKRLDPTPRRVLAAVGPEGGFSNEEIAQALSAGMVPVGLGPRILRAETAAIAVLSILQHRFGDLP